MGKISFAQIHALLREADLQSLPKLNITILSTITVDGIIPYLRYYIYKMGFEALVEMGQFDNVLQDALSDPTGVIKEKTDIIIVFPKLEMISPSLANRFSALTKEAVEEELTRVNGWINTVLTALRNRTQAIILWMGFERPVYPIYGILDFQGVPSQTDAVDALNSNLKQALISVGNAYLVDLNVCLTRLGGDRYFSPRDWHIARAPYSREGLEQIAREIVKYIRAFKGKAKKCLRRMSR